MDPVLEGILGLADLTLHRGPGAMGLGGKIVLQAPVRHRLMGDTPGVAAAAPRLAVKPTVRRPGLVARPPNCQPVRRCREFDQTSQPMPDADQRDRDRIVAHSCDQDFVRIPRHHPLVKYSTA